MSSDRRHEGPRLSVVNALIGLLCLIWGSTWLVIKTGLSDLPPFTAAALRLLLAAIVMVPVAQLLARKEGGARPPLWLSSILGATNFAGSYSIVYWAGRSLPSAHSAVLWAVFPLVLACGAHFFLDHERLVPRQWLGFVVGFLGIVMLHVTDLAALGPEAGFAAKVFFLSPVVTAVGNLAVKRHGGGYSSLLLNRDAMAVAAILVVILAFATEREQPRRFSGAAWFSIGYLAIVGTVVTFSLYYWLLRTATATKMSLIAYITPVVAGVIGFVFGQEPLTSNTVLGLLLILGGVWLARRARPRGAGEAAGSSGGPAAGGPLRPAAEAEPGG